MNSTLQDTIEREMVIRAPKERVYNAIADETQIVQWFPDSMEGKLTPGERPVFDFGEYGKAPIYVVAADPHHYFAYKWLPGANYMPEGIEGDVLRVPHTLVEFRLEDVPDGTRLRLKESGFAGLPPEVYEVAIKDNSGGWDYMLDRLNKFASGE